MELLCPFENFDKLKWLKNGEPLPSATNIRQIDNTLYFSIVLDEYAGNYTCMVENYAGQDSFTYSLMVLSPPNIIERTKEMGNDVYMDDDIGRSVELTVGVGEQLEIECLAIGNPMPKVKKCLIF